MAEAKKILVVDDEQQLALAIKIRLQSRGYQVVLASDGKEAIELIQEEHPDLVILDVLMPVMDGYSCLREMNTRFGRSKTPIIILTARDRMKELFELEGIEDYLVKPFDHEDLLVRIERVLRRREPASSPSTGAAGAAGSPSGRSRGSS